MSNVASPDVPKRLKVSDEIIDISLQEKKEICVQFINPSGSGVGGEINIDIKTTKSQLEKILNLILQDDIDNKYTFSIQQSSDDKRAQLNNKIELDANRIVEINNTIADAYGLLDCPSSETTFKLHYFPLVPYRVRPVTRISGSLEGHEDAVLAVSFRPVGNLVASASGDTTVRIWDSQTQTPQHVLKGHTHWVNCLSWSPDGSNLASGSMDHTVRVWILSPTASEARPNVLRGHTKEITCLQWQPYHLVDAQGSVDCLLASGSKDMTVRIWNVALGHSLYILTSHTKMVTGLAWAGSGTLFSSSRDTFVKAWNTHDGSFVTDLKGHAHWVNHISLNTEQTLKTGPYAHDRVRFTSKKEMQESAEERYKTMISKCGSERLLTCSDDMTMFLWDLKDLRVPLNRMTGHQQAINHVSFSNDGRLIASASFDKSVRLWNGVNGRFVATLRGHVSRVYRLTWSPDSLMLASASADSTIKIWDVIKMKLKHDLAGHSDEVYSIDWQISGGAVASGSKDKLVKIWMH